MESDGKCAVLSTEGDARISESGRNRREASPDPRGITVSCYPRESRRPDIHKNNRNSECQAADTGLTSSRSNEWQQPLDEVQLPLVRTEGILNTWNCATQRLPVSHYNVSSSWVQQKRESLRIKAYCVIIYVIYMLHICSEHAKDSAAAFNILTSGLGSLFNLSTEGKVRPYMLQQDVKSPERQEAGLMH